MKENDRMEIDLLKLPGALFSAISLTSSGIVTAELIERDQNICGDVN